MILWRVLDSESNLPVAIAKEQAGTGREENCRFDEFSFDETLFVEFVGHYIPPCFMGKPRRRITVSHRFPNTSFSCQIACI